MNWMYQMTLRQRAWLYQQQDKSYLEFDNLLHYVGRLKLPDTLKTIHDAEFINACKAADSKKDQL